MLRLKSRSEAETRLLGEKLAFHLIPGSIVLLTGDLGAGKTILTKGLAAGLGVKEVVTSPSFTLMQRYQGRLVLYHFDLYRVEDPEELLELGMEEFLYGEGVSVVEWCERMDQLPPQYLQVALKHCSSPFGKEAALSETNSGTNSEIISGTVGETKALNALESPRLLEFSCRGTDHLQLLTRFQKTLDSNQVIYESRY